MGSPTRAALEAADALRSAWLGPPFTDAERDHLARALDAHAASVLLGMAAGLVDGFDSPAPTWEPEVRAWLRAAADRLERGEQP